MAATVSGYEINLELGSIFYQIDCWQDPHKWTISKRYTDFVELHHSLLDATNISMETISLPKLPGKRWFDPNRWINRYSHYFIDKRRVKLQNYLMSVLRIASLLQRSQIVINFLGVTRPLTFGVVEQDHVAYCEYKRLYTIYYEPIEVDEEDEEQSMSTYMHILLNERYSRSGFKERSAITRYYRHMQHLSVEEDDVEAASDSSKFSGKFPVESHQTLGPLSSINIDDSGEEKIVNDVGNENIRGDAVHADSVGDKYDNVKRYILDAFPTKNPISLLSAT